MDKESHYDLTYLMADMAGFSRDEAYTIAYSSQHVDDNVVQYELRTQNGGYSNYISQTHNILKPANTLLRIYSCFHFMPGDTMPGGQFKDGSEHLMLCEADSDLSRKILGEALSSGNPYLIGIATHMYMDTFSHQNFTGTKHHINSDIETMGITIPSIGHASFGFSPDRVDSLWEDTRLAEQKSICNDARVRTMLEKVLSLYSRHTGKTLDVESTINVILSFIESMPFHKRMNAYKGFGIPEYNRGDWIGKIIDSDSLLHRLWRTTKSKIWSMANSFATVKAHVATSDGEFYDSDWYKFQKAIKTYQAQAEEWIKQSSPARSRIIEQMEHW